MSEKIEIKEGEIYFPKSDLARNNFRRVIAVIGDLIFFSVGGDKNFACKRNSFLAWRSHSSK